jgi:hypothetical protein
MANINAAGRIYINLDGRGRANMADLQRTAIARDYRLQILFQLDKHSLLTSSVYIIMVSVIATIGLILGKVIAVQQALGTPC